MSAINVHADGTGVEIWLDCENSDGSGDEYSGLVIGTGDTWEEARADAIADLRTQITKLETMADPAVASPVTPDDEDEDDDDE